MDEEIADTEGLAIFVLDSKKIKGGAATWQAFMPSKVDGERSLFRVDDLTILDIAEIGQKEVGDVQKPVSRKIKGWAHLIASQVRQSPPLELVAAEPPIRHAVIKNWPVEIQEKERIALDLAGIASTHVL